MARMGGVAADFRWPCTRLQVAARAARVQARSEIYLFAALPFKLDASTDRRTPTAWIRHATPMETDADSDGGRPNKKSRGEAARNQPIVCSDGTVAVDVMVSGGVEHISLRLRGFRTGEACSVCAL